jgi:hypothetical protein
MEKNKYEWVVVQLMIAETGWQVAIIYKRQW